MKRILIFAASIFSLLLCACAQGEPITSQEFSAIMEKKGFTVEDHTEYLDQSLPESRDAERIKAWGEFFVCFDKFADSEKAENIFNVWVNYYSVGDDCSIKYKSGRYLQVEYVDYNGEENVFILSRVENTLIQVNTNIEFDEEAKRLLEELGYDR